MPADIAEATVNILLGENHENKEYNISNTHSIYSRGCRLALCYIRKNHFLCMPSIEGYKNTLAGSATPEMVADMLAGFSKGIVQGELVAGNIDLSELFGREAVSYMDFLKGFFAQK